MAAQLKLFPNQSTQDMRLGDCLDIMRSMESNSITHILTDPPYMINFMGKDFDKFENNPAANIDLWKEALRICKPGSMLLAFGGDRTHHHLMNAIEQAGWEIRTCLYWLTGQGFPKSHNNFGFEGYGTALKPAAEIIVMAMKPLDGTFAQNAQKHGVAGINIDECRIGTDQITTQLRDRSAWHGNNYGNGGYEKPIGESEARTGRWPANILFDEEAAKLLDEQSGQLTSGKLNAIDKPKTNEIYGKYNHTNINQFEANSGGASRFFYCAKASSSERNKGLEDLPNYIGKRTQDGGDDTRGRPLPINKNNHPTVKPIKLMEYLLKLITPPKDGIVLDPFAGSGTTLIAAKNLDINAIGIEKCPEYFEIAKKRIENA